MNAIMKWVAAIFVVQFVGCSAPPFREIVSNDLAPGVQYSHYRNAAPNNIHVLRVDLRDPNIVVESARTKGLVRLTEILKEISSAESPVVGAVNADFFSFKSGWPVGIQMHNGELWTALETVRSHLVVTNDGKLLISSLTFNGVVKNSGSSRWVIDALNQPVPERGSVLFTPRWYDSTNATGVRLRPVEASGLSDAGMAFIVDSAGFFDKTSLQEGRALLAFGRKTSDSLGERLPRYGDTLWVSTRLSPEIAGAKEVLGGAGRLLLDGKVQVEENIKSERLSKDFIERRHPRTFLGLDREGRTLLLCVVDGRQANSVGMSFREMAEFLVFLGADQGFNFDGGGSTTMVVNGRIVNSPSDKTGERAVANALVIRTAGLPN
jgi:hypothetical protein